MGGWRWIPVTRLGSAPTTRTTDRGGLTAINMTFSFHVWFLSETIPDPPTQQPGLPDLSFND